MIPKCHTREAAVDFLIAEVSRHEARELYELPDESELKLTIFAAKIGSGE